MKIEGGHLTLAETSRNPGWQRDELILALDLYYRHNPRTINKSHPEVLKLSSLLNDLPIHSNRPDAERFRNPNGVYMKLMNFLAIDPEYSGVGLSQGSKADRKIWNEFSQNRTYLHQVAQNIAQNVRLSHPDSDSLSPSDEEEDEFPEGRVLYRLHRSRERNTNKVKQFKDKALREGKLRCEVCNFDFHKTYGDLGKGYIECHHIVPISEYSPTDKTRLSDLALVCSNCHRMLHRRRPWLSISELAQLVSLNKGANT